MLFGNLMVIKNSFSLYEFWGQNQFGREPKFGPFSCSIFPSFSFYFLSQFEVNLHRVSFEDLVTSQSIPNPVLPISFYCYATSLEFGEILLLLLNCDSEE